MTTAAPYRTWTVQQIRPVGLTRVRIAWKTETRERGFFEVSAGRFEQALAGLEPMRKAVLLDVFGARSPQARRRTYSDVATEYGLSKQRIHVLAQEACLHLFEQLWRNGK